MENELRAYFLCLRGMSSIQQGIQAGHAVVEYGLKYHTDEMYQEWAINHKTFILLDGGTSVDMLNHHKFLTDIGKKHSVFYEPDLNMALTSICLILSKQEFEVLYDLTNGSTVHNVYRTRDPKYQVMYDFISNFRFAR